MNIGYIIFTIVFLSIFTVGLFEVILPNIKGSRNKKQEILFWFYISFSSVAAVGWLGYMVSLRPPNYLSDDLKVITRILQLNSAFPLFLLTKRLLKNRSHT